MIKQNTNSTNNYYDNLIIEENQNPDFKPTSPFKVANEDQYNMNNMQYDNTSGTNSHNSSVNIFDKDKAVQKNELPFTDDEKGIDKKVSLAIDESQDYDIEYVNERPQILNEPEMMEEKEAKNESQSEGENGSEEVNIISALNKKERNEDVVEKSSEIADNPGTIEKQKDLHLKEEDEGEEVNIISALNKKERNNEINTDDEEESSENIDESENKNEQVL